jgi:hypothetical protein
MRGRRPAGPECVEQVAGSEQAKKRARTLLETMTGDCRVTQACEILNVSEPRYHQLKTHMVATLVASMEPGHAGRPAQQLSPEQEKIAALERQLAEMEVKLQAVQARAEIALVLPNVVHDQPQPEKKTRRLPTQQRPSRNRPPGRKKNT